MDTIYYWFSNLYGMPLDNLMRGVSADGISTGVNHYTMFGILTLVIAVAIAVVYYYVINHPRFNRWGSWLLMLAACGILNWLFGSIYTSTLFSGFEGMDPLTFFSFGFANCVISMIWFLIASLVMKWWSRNCKHSPFI